MSISRRQLLLGLPAALASRSVLAQRTPWPERPIRILVGFPPGQSGDLNARRYAPFLARDLGQNVFIENRPGANGILAGQELKNSKPDGYTLLLGSSGQLGINPGLYRNLPYDPVKDFAPVAMTVRGCLYLVAHPSLPVNNLQELLAYARSRPGQINYGSGGNGITGHLGMEILQTSTGIKLHHVPYKGLPQALNDLLAGTVMLGMDAAQAVMPQVRSGRLKVLGATSIARSAAYPNIPTIAEQGVAGYDVTAWNGFVAPAGTPPAVIAAIHKSVRNAHKDPIIETYVKENGLEVSDGSPEDFGVFIRNEVVKFGRAVAQAGVQID